MGDNSGALTPTSCRYQLRSRTPTTPKTPSTPADRILRSTSTPVSNGNVKQENLSFKSTPVGRQLSMSTPQTEEKLVFRTPMSYKPRIVGNKPVPSPSRQELWRHELGLADDPSSDKENSSSEDEESHSCNVSLVEYRALQKVLAEKNSQRDETLLVIKNYKDMIRHYKSRLEREESTKKQQLKIMRKTHEVQLQEKDTLVENLNSIIQEHEDKIKEMEEAVSTPRRTRKTAKAPKVPEPKEQPESIVKLVDEIQRLQSEKSLLTVKLNDVQLELTNLKQDTTQEIMTLKETVSQLEKARNSVVMDKKHSSLKNLSLCNSKLNITSSCCSDVEKKVDVLQAENARLLQELTDVKNAETKAVTHTKLSSHRQQQMEDEIKRLKQRQSELENEVVKKTDTVAEKVQEHLSISNMNTELQAEVRELQAKLVCHQAKSPEIVTVTKVKQVESESLRKQYETCKTELQQLKQVNEEKKKELNEAQTQVNYLQRLVEMTQSKKDSSEATLWKELEAMNSKHQTSLKQLHEKLAAEKQNEIKMLENRLVYENKKELHELVESMNEKHRLDIKGRESLQKSSQSKLEEELSKHKEEKTQLISEFQEQKCHLQEQIETMTENHSAEISSLLKNYEIESKELEKRLMSDKTKALNKQKEELQKEKHDSLHMLEEKLVSEHKESMAKMEASHCASLEEAVNKERETTAEKMNFLESNYSELTRQLCELQPVISTFIESYILLQKEVARFPKVMQKTVKSVKQEVTMAIAGVSEYNKELVQKYQKEMKLRKKYHNELVELKGNIRVFCRVRPLIKEDGQGQQAESIVSLDHDDDGVLFVNSKGRTQTFEVDKVFSEHSTQIQVFEEVKSLVTSCIDGYNVCIFAYGQTGSGKTYTMEGTRSDPGINQRALNELFEETTTRHDWEYTITVSVIEIYNEMIRDLLGEDTSYKMEVKMNPDGGYHIPGLSYVVVNSANDVNEWFQVGQKNRATACTNMNEHSSRSHALLCVTVTGCNKLTGAKTTGKLNLVDLAGSERVSKSKADGARLKEAQSINKSLSSLGDVISALRSKQSHIPYRNSKLTYLLQDSLGGDSKTLMITQIAPVRKNEGETVCSLNFAQRVRHVELGAATKKLESGDGTELIDPEEKNEFQSSPARMYNTPQKMIKSSNLLSSTPNGPNMKPSTPLGDLGSPRMYNTPQKMIKTSNLLSVTPNGPSIKPSTPSSSGTPNKGSTPTTSKLTPSRPTRRK